MPAARVQWIDFCRVYTAFFVVLRHVDRTYGTVNYVVDLFNYRSLIFFFFLMSGYFTRQPGAGEWLGLRRARQLAVPYVFWGLAGMLVAYSPHIGQGDWGWLTWQGVVSQLGLTSWCYWSYSNVPLWFLRTLILLALVSPLLYRLPVKVLLSLGVVCFAASDVLCNVDLEAATANFRPEHGQGWLPFRLYESVLALGFFCGGIALRRLADTERLTRWVSAYAWVPVLGALALLPYVLGWGFYPPVQSSSLVLLGVATTMGIGCLCSRYLPRLCSAVAKLGPAAFFVYVTHYPILDMVRYTLTGSIEGHLSPELCYVLPFLIFGTCIGLFYLLRRICPAFLRTFALCK